MLFASVYSYTKSIPFSLPNPEFPTPPNGISGGKNQIFIYRPYARDAYLGILLSEQQPKSVGYLVYPNRILFASVYSYTKSIPFSLPNPEFPTPPNGISGGRIRFLFTARMPATPIWAYCSPSSSPKV